MTTPVAQEQPKQSSGLAIASLILSVAGLMTGFIYIGILLALIGLILGIVSLASRKGGKALAITGISIGGFCLLIAPLTIFMAVNFWAGFAEGMNEGMNEYRNEQNSTRTFRDYNYN